MPTLPAGRGIFRRTARITRSAAVCAVLVGLSWAGACLDQTPFLVPVIEDSIPDTTRAIVSNPVAISSGTGAAFAIVGTASEVVYVSLVPGTIPQGGLATIRNTRTLDTVSAAMAAGGFDPVAIEADVGDTLVVDVMLEGGGFAPEIRLPVLAIRRPIVVRTDPPPRKRDVPLNAVLVVVFSEPIQPSSAAAIRLERGGAPVSGSVSVTADGLRGVIEPDQPLAPNATYTLSVPTNVTDLDGEGLEQPELVEFETGATAALASVSTQEAALITNPSNGALRAFNMSAILHDDGRVTGYFSIFYPELGTGSAGRVTCFTIVDGTAAWIGGVAEQSANLGNIGAEFVWRAADNGQRGAAVADRLSLARFDPVAPPGQAAQYCAATPISDQLFDLVGGDLVVAGATAAPPDPPLSSAGVSQIAYWIDGILILPADRNAGWPLTAAPSDRNPAWSPDGRTLAFQSDRDQPGNVDIYAINWNRSGLRRLTSGSERDQDPAWSPDGTRIAFSRSGSIHLMNADGSNVTRLSFTGFDSHPSWSPDSSRIVFASSRTGINAIHVMNADGSNVVQLTSDSAADYHPSWSPDGGRIAFQRNPQRFGWIYVVNPDGTGLTRVVSGQTPSWSPDGRRILYEMFGMTFVMADGSGLTRFFNGFNPAWSPVGTMPPEPAPFRFVEMVSGDGQTGTVGTTLAQALSVRVVHDDGTPQPGVTVRWNVWGTGQGVPSATLGPVESITDAAGVATRQLTLGSLPGPVRVRAALVDGTARIGEVLFTATATPPPVPAAVVVSVGGSTCSPPPCGVLIFALGRIVQFTAAVLDKNNDTITGQTIIWSSSDTAVATVSAVGLMTAVGNGNTEVTAHAGTLNSVPTPVTVAQEVTLLQKVAGDDQSDKAGAQLPTAIVVRALDNGGSPIPGATVNFTVIQGGGVVSAPSVVTTADGQAVVTWTLGTSLGVQQLRASARRMQFVVHPTPPSYPDPLPLTFEATAVP